MIVYEKKQGKIVLNDQDFLAEGGEGRLYVRGNEVYKIYHDPAHVLPMAKFDELQKLDHPNIIRPVALLTNDKQQPIGYTMKRASNAVPLPQLFTTSFREQHKITPAMSIELVKNMQAVIAAIHKKGFLMVDGNEFNYIVDQSNWVTPYFIDVDSWQTPTFKASAIMPSIRDYTVNGFSELTDWFSFAIVACQIFLGIHPFKGRHPDFAKGDFEARIQARVSVFNPTVTYPSSVRDYLVIPKPYYDWFVDLFEKGIRRPPPDGEMQVRAVQKRVTWGDGAQVVMRLLRTFDESLKAYKEFNGTPMGLVGDTLMVGNGSYAVPKKTQAIVLLMDHTPVFMGIEDNCLMARHGQELQLLAINLHASRVFAAGNTAYAINSNQLIELTVQSLNGRVLIVPGKVVHIMPNAHEVFAGMLIQRVMGKPYLILPYKPGSLAQIPVPELTDYRIVDARYTRGVALIKAATRNGRYDIIRLRFNEHHSRYDLDIRQDYDEPINFTVIDRGVVVQLVEDGKLEVYLNSPDSPNVRVVEDAALRMDMQLFDHGGRLGAYQSNQVISMSLAGS